MLCQWVIDTPRSFLVRFGCLCTGNEHHRAVGRGVAPPCGPCDGASRAESPEPYPQGGTFINARKLFSLLLVILVAVVTLAAEGDCEMELVADSPTPPPPPAAIEATVEARVPERLQGQSLTPNPRLECDNPDLLARAEQDFNIRYRPHDKIARIFDIQEASRDDNELKCAALVTLQNGDWYQLDYAHRSYGGRAPDEVFAGKGYMVDPTMPIPEPTATTMPTPHPTLTPTHTHTPLPPQTATLLPTAIATPEPTATATMEPTPTPTPPATATATPRPTGPVSSPQELAERFEASIVKVVSRRGLFFASSGTGFIFDVEGGTAFVATNHHVIDGAGALDVELASGTIYEALLLGWDADRDIAVLAICCGADFVPIPWEPVTPAPDLNVVAIGYPRGGTEGQTITVGEVVAADAHSTQYDFITHSAPLNPGNSGGPLFLMPEAKLLGVNTARSLQTLTFYAVPYQLIAEPMKEWRSNLVTKPVPTPEPDSSFDTVQVMGSLYTVNRVMDPAKGRPAAGMRLVSVDVTQEALVDNVSYSHWDFHVQDTDSFIYGRSNSGDAEPSFSVGTLATDQKVRGWITFEVPATATLVSILVETSGFNSQKHVIADLSARMELRTPAPK